MVLHIVNVASQIFQTLNFKILHLHIEIITRLAKQIHIYKHTNAEIIYGTYVYISRQK